MYINGEKIIEYYGKPYVKVNGNEPNFSECKWKEKSCEICNAELAKTVKCICIGKNSIPKGRRKNIKSVKIPGFHNAEYDFIDGRYLYNYCHLIGYQLSGDRSKGNLIIGTRYMNVQGMQHFEDEVAKYVRETGNHVLYRVCPISEGDNRVPFGVQMEAKSVEDNGDGIHFNVFCYNVQPGVFINYKNGDSNKDDEWCRKLFTRNNIYKDEEKVTHYYILNTYTHKFHKPGCNCVTNINEENKHIFKWPVQFLIDNGCKLCKNCKP